jgi:hypothetical protein
MTETAELTAVNGKAGSELGYSVAISGTTLFAGAPFEHSHEGVSWMFREPAGGWRSGSGGISFAASDGATNDGFGTALGVGGGVTAVSAYGWTGGTGNDEGAVYVFGAAQ